MTALIEHARSSIMYEKQLLRELEALRVDVDSAAKKVVPSANGVPKPKYIPPLEDPPLPPPSAPVANGFHRSPPPQHLAAPQTAVPSQSSNQRFHVPRLPGLPPEPISATSAISHESSEEPFSPASTTTQPKQPLSSQPGLSNGPDQVVRVTSPPLGRFTNGTKSMIIQSTSSHSQGPQEASSSTSILPNAAGPAPDPLSSKSAQASSSVDPLGALVNPTPQTKLQPGIRADPLANIKPHQMSSSVRLPSHRPRLDPREAASKLANLF
jgi:hypothetical protein